MLYIGSFELVGAIAELEAALALEEEEEEEASDGLLLFQWWLEWTFE